MLAALTLLMYGMVSFLGQGPFAFFPVNELVFFVLVVYFALTHFKSAKVSYALLLSLACVDLLNNQLFLGFFLDNEQIQAFYDHPLYKYVRMVSYALILAEITRFYIQSKWKFAMYLYPLMVIPIVAGVLLKVYLFQVLGLTLFVGMLHFYYKKHETEPESYHKSIFHLWYFLTFLKLSSLLTMYLYDLRFE